MINIRKMFGLAKYISDLDQFLLNFDKTHPKLSTSQQLEQKKYAHIFDLRDHPEKPSPQKTFWNNF